MLCIAPINEMGFDYLEITWLFYQRTDGLPKPKLIAIVDEVDSILIWWSENT